LQLNKNKHLSADEIEIRIWAFVVTMVTFILFFIVVSLIYRTTFVVQPLKSISPMDQADQKMLNDIVLLIVGGIGGIMTRKGVKAASDMIAAATPLSMPSVPNNKFGSTFSGFQQQPFVKNNDIVEPISKPSPFSSPNERPPL